MVDGRCEIGFTDLDRAKMYCEHSGECVGVKEMPCNQISVNMDCVGTFWRPFSSFFQSETGDDGNHEKFGYASSAPGAVKR